MIVVDTTDPAFSRDPHEILRDARRRSPIAFDAFGTPMLLRYADVDAALKDPRFVNDYDVLLTRHGITSGPLFDWWKLAMLNTNPPVHTRLRSLASPEAVGYAVRAVVQRDGYEPLARVRLFEDLAGYFRGLAPFPDSALDGLTDEQFVRSVLRVIMSSR